MKNTKDKKIQFCEYAKHFSDQISNADNLRDESMQRLRKIRASRQKNQQRQLNRLVKKRADNDALVIRQVERIDSEKAMANYMDVAIDKSAVDTYSIKDSYILKGKVRDDRFKDLAGQTVQLIDARNEIVGKPIKTDQNGNYTFVVDIDKKNELKKLNVVVLDKQGVQIYKDKLPVSLKAGVVDMRDMLVTKKSTIDSGKTSVKVRKKDLDKNLIFDKDKVNDGNKKKGKEESNNDTSKTTDKIKKVKKTAIKNKTVRKRSTKRK